LTKLPSAVALAAWFWLTYVTIGMLTMLIDLMQRVPPVDRGTYLSRDIGLGVSWLIPMSVAAAIAFGCVVSVGNRVLRRRNRRPLGSPWFAVASAVGATGFALTGAPTLIWHVTDWMLGPDSMWGIATLPAGLTILGAVVSGACVAGIRTHGLLASGQEAA
jgi:hypothetical protein